MNNPWDSDSVFDEPHLQKRPPRGDPEPGNPPRPSQERKHEDEGVEHTVWDEPALSRELVGERKDDELNYGNWLAKRWQQTPPATSWLVTAAVIGLSGPWALLGAFVGGFFGRIDAPYAMTLAIVIVGPVTEELMKIAAALYIVEKRPFLFHSPVQIFACALAGAAVFAAVENVLYIRYYVEEPTQTFIQWRWTICVALHVGCSLIAGMGLAAMWRAVWRRRQRAQLATMFPYLVTAMVVHGLYNAFAIVLSVSKYHF